MTYNYKFWEPAGIAEYIFRKLVCKLRKKEHAYSLSRHSCRDRIVLGGHRSSEDAGDAPRKRLAILTDRSQRLQVHQLAMTCFIIFHGRLGVERWRNKTLAARYI